MIDRSIDRLIDWGFTLQEDNPISRFRKYITQKGFWNDEKETQWRDNAKKQVMVAFQKAEKKPRPAPEDLFNDVYDELPWNLRKQRKEMLDSVRNNPEQYPLKEHAKIGQAWPEKPCGTKEYFSLKLIRMPSHRTSWFFFLFNFSSKYSLNVSSSMTCCKLSPKNNKIFCLDKLSHLSYIATRNIISLCLIFTG